MRYPMNTESEVVAQRVQATLDYLESPRGIAHWDRNRDLLKMPVEHNYRAAIQTATGLIVFERIEEVFQALGPALNVRRCRRRVA